MIIDRKTAEKLFVSGNATCDNRVYHNGATYAVVNRLDIQRTDHVFVGYGDLRRNMPANEE